MVTLKELLTIANEKKASDLHVTAGIPPICRINGVLTDLGYDTMLPEDMVSLLEPVFNEHTKSIFDELGEVDLSYSIPELGRYRVNIFKQRGSYACVIRLVGTDIPKPNELNIPFIAPTQLFV